MRGARADRRLVARGSCGGLPCPERSGAARSASVWSPSLSMFQRNREPLDPVPPVPPGGHGPGAGAEGVRAGGPGGHPVGDRQGLRVRQRPGHRRSPTRSCSELPLPTAKAIEIQAFVPLESIDPIRIGEGYYLVPDGQVAAKPYKLLRAGPGPVVEGGDRQVRVVGPGTAGPAAGARRRDRAACDALAGRSPRPCRRRPAARGGVGGGDRGRARPHGVDDPRRSRRAGVRGRLHRRPGEDHRGEAGGQASSPRRRSPRSRARSSTSWPR